MAANALGFIGIIMISGLAACCPRFVCAIFRWHPFNPTYENLDLCSYIELMINISYF